MNVKFFDLAKKIAKLSDHPKFKLGCVIVKKRKILGKGCNMIKTSPHSNHPFNMIHAELSAILNADKQSEIRNADFYIYRETKTGKLAQSFPCSYCLTLLENCGIKNLYHTGDGCYVYSKLV